MAPTLDAGHPFSPCRGCQHVPPAAPLRCHELRVGLDPGAADGLVVGGPPFLYAPPRLRHAVRECQLCSQANHTNQGGKRKDIFKTIFCGLLFFTLGEFVCFVFYCLCLFFLFFCFCSAAKRFHLEEVHILEQTFPRGQPSRRFAFIFVLANNFFFSQCVPKISKEAYFLIFLIHLDHPPKCKFLSLCFFCAFVVFFCVFFCVAFFCVCRVFFSAVHVASPLQHFFSPTNMNF